MIPSAPQSYTTAFYYDSYLRPYATQYPDGEVVKVNYNSMGLPSLMCSAYWNSGQNAYWCDSNPWYVSDANYDEAGRLRYRKLPAGGNLWQSYYYFPWGGADGNSNGRLWYIGLGTNPNGYDRMLLDYRYDSFGNVSQHNPNEGVWNSFSYDAQNRLTAGYGRSYGYDSAGRMSSYEGTTQSYHPYRPHAMAPNWSQYAVDLNGNFTSRVQNGVAQTLTWDHENRLASVTGSGINESYLYDADGQRVKKTSNGVATYYVNQYYEVSGSTVTKYYYFGGQRVAMKKGTVLTYLHGDALGSTVLETNTSGNATADQKYYAYGKQRDTGPVVTEHKFTGQKLDGTGLQYYNARYYDSVIGAFISPDTIVPDGTSVFSYNRYMYTSGNPLNRIDPTGHVDGSPYLDPGTNCYQWCGVATMNPQPHPMAGPLDLPTREQVHTALDVVGTVDPTGLADGTNALIYASEGEYANAILSTAALLPLGDALKAGRYADEAAEIVSHADNFDDARRLAFEYAGMTDPSQVKFTKVDPVTGTIVEFKGPGGAKVAYDSPHISDGPGHEMPHIGWQTGGKRAQSGAARGNITCDGPQHPFRSPVKGMGDVGPH